MKVEDEELMDRRLSAVSILIYLEVKNEAATSSDSTAVRSCFNPNLSGSKK